MLAFGTAGAEVGQDRAELARWVASAAAVLAVYAVALAVLLTWKSPAPPLVAPPPAAMMIDLAPLPPPPQPVAAPPPPPEPVKPPEPKRAIKPPRLALPLPPPREPAPPKPVRPPEPPVAAPAAPAPAPVIAPPVAAPAPPAVNVLSAFESKLIAHLERYKHYPQSARTRHQQGVVRMRFTMDRSGRVLSARIAQSSGVPALDDEVLAMIERAAPLPAFPPEIAQAQLDLLLPISFSLR